MNDKQNIQEEQNILEKYGRDICRDVRDGKIDPVIGRDEEIRNIIQVLSRKTKNNAILNLQQMSLRIQYKYEKNKKDSNI